MQILAALEPRFGHLETRVLLEYPTLAQFARVLGGRSGHERVEGVVEASAALQLVAAPLGSLQPRVRDHTN